MNSDSAAIAQGLARQGRQALIAGDAAEGQRLLSLAHSIQPTQDGLLLDVAAACMAAGDLSGALQHAEAAALHEPGWKSSVLLANISLKLGQKEQAALGVQAALGDADLPVAVRGQLLQQLADLQLNTFGDARAAAESLRHAAKAVPALRLQSVLGQLVAHLYEGTRSARDLAADFANLGRQLKPQPRHVNRAPIRQRLRIGVLSQQFCASPVAFLTLGALTELARSSDLYLFDRGGKSDWARERFRQIASEWIACASLDTAALQQKLIESELDALIDLSGWTDPVALLAQVAHPARRQLKWVGGQSLTTGLQCFDGFVTDTRQVPAAAAPFYTEPLLHAQHGYVSYVAPPYASYLTEAAARIPRPRGTSPQGVVALVSNPAKISADTAKMLCRMRPRKLWLVDHRWRHEGTRTAARRKLGNLLDVAEFVAPANHPEYLQVLQDLDARFIDTAPYSMGLTAIELRLLGKHIVTTPRSPSALMCERHCGAHMEARRFDHHTELAEQLLGWCRAS